MRSLSANLDAQSLLATASRPSAMAAPLSPGAILGRIGPLEVRLAAGEDEIARAQTLRFAVFSAEFGMRSDVAAIIESRDADRFDEVCDHLLVIDTSLPGPDIARIVGTYRLLRHECAGAAGGFYSSAEFELEALVSRHPGLRFLELGRSCVLPAYRGKRTIELLWQGIWAYVNHYGLDVMTGCASFKGVVPAAHAPALSFLAHHATASGAWATRAVASRYQSMDLMPQEAIGAKAAFAAMPPLVKGYLRLGAMVGEGCVVDQDFGTTDVLIILPVSIISQRYVAYYGAEAQRFAA